MSKIPYRSAFSGKNRCRNMNSLLSVWRRKDEPALVFHDPFSDPIYMMPSATLSKR
jgi:hypothetical protein